MEQGRSATTEPAHLEVAARIADGIDAERARIAQELHDGPAQALANAIFALQIIERQLEHDPADARAGMAELRDRLGRELEDIRAAIASIRLPVLDELGLNGALEEALARLRTVTALQVTTGLAADPDLLPEAAQTVVLRVAREALQNVRKHAGATHVVLATRMNGRDWVLEVRDDGRGFDVGAASRGRNGFGLQFMRERAAVVGARLEIRSSPGTGTLVRLAIPTTREEIG